MALIPLDLIVLVFAALLSRAFNRFPPVWERFLGGLRYFSAPSERDIALFIKQATARAWSVVRAVSLATAAATLHSTSLPRCRCHSQRARAPSLQESYDENVAVMATALVQPRARTIAYSYFPLMSFPWDDVIIGGAANVVAAAAGYAAFAAAFATTYELVSGLTNVYADFVLVATLLLVLSGPVQVRGVRVH